ETYFAQPGARSKLKTEVWELATGKKSVLCQDYAYQTVFPDGQTVMVGELYTTWVLKLLRLSTGMELANVKRPVDDRYFSTGDVAPDGSVVAVSLGWKKGATVEVLFLDGKTLEQRGKLVGTGDAEGRPWGGGRFTPDGKRFIILDRAGN